MYHRRTRRRDKTSDTPGCRRSGKRPPYVEGYNFYSHYDSDGSWHESDSM